jgi:hypothetical protein
MQIEPIFPQAVIGFNKIDVDHNKILKYIENIEFEQTNSSIKKEADLYVSKNYNILKDIGDLKNEICKNVKNYLNNIMKLKMDFQFTTSWVTKATSNGYCQKHYHSNSFLSGVYYPVGDKNFSIRFYKKIDLWNVQTTENNNLNSEWYDFHVIENSVLILFPSHLEQDIQ